jgi:CRP-like cAMP-binding protein
MRSILSFCAGLPEQSFAAGEVLIAEGGREDKLFVLIEGEVEILKGDTEINVVSDPGAVFGEMAVLLESAHTATVRTTAPTRLYVAEHADAFLRSNPELNYLVAKLLAKRLYAVSTYLADLKRQFEEHADHLGMVDEVLETLLHQHDDEFTPGSDRDPDPKM